MPDGRLTIKSNTNDVRQAFTATTFSASRKMSTVIDVSGRLGEYMLKGWVGLSLLYSLTNSLSTSNPGSYGSHLQKVFESAFDAFAYGQRYILLRQLR